ncbi:hypothetical protein [Mongoliitalea daihaiensis]|uniref:hypothetical protein n=1 Tax=Mongoliitalea daihaiensis TaxID=2782006 RepID=UPI001F27428A|nr:hypothetical protein [Mongoliitalea daihaiensis]UJP66788.1 hypothetical protein IPZ59_09455 [Mongoliitalea daihaiensis]
MQPFKKILPLFSRFALVLMLSILANGVLFFHTHELECGKIITHAHPLITEEQQELPDHGHSEMELIILDLIAEADFFIFDYCLDIPEAPVSDQFLGASSYSSKISCHFPVGFDLRGPPIS